MARLARSLETLRNQLNTRYPNRNKLSDGWIGDAAHKAKGGAKASQHNPNDADVVCALDITHDPVNGVDCDRLMEELDASNDARIFYLIYDWEIDNSDDTRTKYKGSNGHTRHLHISVRYTRPDLYDDPTPWNLPMLYVTTVTPAPPVTRPVAGRPTVKRGSTGQVVRDLQTILGRKFPSYRHKNGVLVIDGDFGPTTEKWVKEFQRRSKLTVDGIVGPKTWAALG